MKEKSNEPGQTISLPDGRQLGYLIVGEGKPVFFFHGSPGCRLMALLLKGIAGSKHLQIIGVDRPGFGLSTYAPNRKIRDFAVDVSHLADHLRIEKSALVGWSMGGHYVTTYAALFPKRVTQAVVLGGLSLPLDTSKMHLRERIGLRLVTMPIIGTWLMGMDTNDRYLKMARDPDAFQKSKQGRNYLKGLTEDEVQFYITPSENRDLIFRTRLEGYRPKSSIRADVQDVSLIKKGWDVDLSQLPPGLIHIWHGSADTGAPVGNAHRNAKVIPGAHLKIFENEGHKFFLNHLEELGELLSS